MPEILIHSELIPYINNFVLSALHSRVHGEFAEWVMAWRQGKTLPEDRWLPRALEAYHDLLVAEMAYRGQIGHVCHPKDNVEIKQLLDWDSKELMSSTLPEGKQGFMMDTCSMYTQELFAGGRRPASPSEIIDLIQWADVHEREAALLLFKEQWEKCGSPY